VPTLSRWFIKAGLIYFVLGLSMATLVVAQPVLNLPPQLAAFRPVYLHLLMVGWLTQLIMGVAFWMFPKKSKEHPRGSESVGWLVLILLNTGLILRALAEPLFTLQPEWGIGWLLEVSAVFQLAAGWIFVANTWGRVKER
jgi:hypothetical protein